MHRPRLRLVPLWIAAAVVAGIVGLLLPMPRSRKDAASRSPRLGLTLASTADLQSGGVSSGEPLADRRIIRTGALSIEVGRYAEAAPSAVAIAEACGGHLSAARASRGTGERQRGTLTLSVEARSFDVAFRKLKDLGRVESASIETQDVTRAYADLETRLSVKRDAQARMREILRSRTGSLSDLVEAERELSRLVEEAERLEGERRFLAKQVELATITLDLFEPAAFLRDGAAAPLFEALREALPLLARSASVMLYAAAAALPWAILGLLVWKARKRARVRRLIRIAGAEG
jgi:hypothetical protein